MPVVTVNNNVPSNDMWHAFQQANDCQSGRVQKGGPFLFKSSKNSYFACHEKCVATPGCVAFDYTTTSQWDACRGVQAGQTPRLGSNDVSRQYCTMYDACPPNYTLIDGICFSEIRVTSDYSYNLNACRPIIERCLLENANLADRHEIQYWLNGVSTDTRVGKILTATVNDAGDQNWVEDGEDSGFYEVSCNDPELQWVCAVQSSDTSITYAPTHAPTPNPTPTPTSNPTPNPTLEQACVQSDTKYIHWHGYLDMQGEPRSQEDTYDECRERCRKVAGCAHISFWQNGGCHLQDNSATSETETGVMAGPPACESQYYIVTNGGNCPVGAEVHDTGECWAAAQIMGLWTSWRPGVHEDAWPHTPRGCWQSKTEEYFAVNHEQTANNNGGYNAICKAPTDSPTDSPTTPAPTPPPTFYTY